MDIRDYLSDDGQAVLTLCSGFALPQGPEAEGLEPFKLSEWNQLARQIQDSPFKTPAGLQGQASAELAEGLSVPVEQAERIAKLLDRAGRLALELEGLFAKGMWAVTRVDEQYPPHLRKTLKHQAPSVLFGAGEIRLAQRGGVAVVGSRDLDEAGVAFAQAVGRKLAAAKLPVVSGGARGSDRVAMGGALEAGGEAVGVLADSLERTVRQPDLRQLLLDGQLALLTPYAPTAGFSVGAAMGRNKLIYGLAEFSVVVSSDFQTGGTWAGAVEALRAGWCPVFVREAPEAPTGNGALVKMGAVPVPAQALTAIEDLAQWLREHAQAKPREQDLFS